MLIGLFERRCASPDGTALSHRWRLPASLIKYRSQHCVIAADTAASVACSPGSAGGFAQGSRVVVVFEGFLDNRRELRDECGLPTGVATSDGALIGALYRRFGRACPSRLSGEFRFILYDEREQALIASVDFASTRRLWWREHGSLVIVASNIGALYSVNESVHINEDYLVERLASGLNNGRLGPLAGAARLLAGETLCVLPRTLTVSKYWCPTMFRAEDSATRMEEECIAEFAHLLREAVQLRIPRQGSFLCELSGGLDSTSITTMAGSLLSHEAGARLHAVTVSYPGAPRTDERTAAASVARAAGAVHHILEWPASASVFGGMPENAFYWDEPRFNAHSHATAVAKHRLLRSIGGQIVLSGSGAEPLLCGYIAWPLFLADSLIRGRWRELLEGLRRWQASKKSSFIMLLYHACLGPLLWPAMAMTYEARRAVPHWLTSRTRRRFEQLRARQVGPIVNRRNTSGAWMAEQWQAAGSVADQGYGAYTYETRFPFLHRPLVESVFRMPWSVRVAPDRNKVLLRRLAADLLPLDVATKASQGGDQAVSRALAAQDERVRGFVATSVLGELGLIDNARFQHSVSLAQNGFGRGLRFIVTTLAIELWTRSVLSGDWRRMQVQHLWPR